MRHALAVSPLILAALCGCQSTGFTSADEAANRELTLSFARAAEAGDWDTLAGLYTDDAILMPPGVPEIRGRAGIRDHFAAMPDVREMNLELLEVGGAGDRAFVRGHYTMELLLPGDVPVQDAGHYVEIRERGSDGRWRIARDIYSSDGAAGHAGHGGGSR
jgi:uncharacterized protein (TIGR02246 family)